MAANRARIASIDGDIGAYAIVARRQAHRVRRHARTATRSGRTANPICGSSTRRAARRGTSPVRFDFDIDGGIGGDQRAPRGQHPGGPVWTRDGRSVLIKVGERGNANLVRVDVANRQAGAGHQRQSRSDVLHGRRNRATVRVRPLDADDRRRSARASTSQTQNRPKKLTTFNDELFNQLTMNEPEEIWYPSFDGRKIQGWILKPPAFDASQKYPLILQIHGGPHSAYGNTFTHEFQWMAAKGYVVLYTNPRGSSNYGQDFGNIIQFTYPGDDYKDLMAGVDETLKKGYVDETRMGVTGGSGGGLLTNWVVTQTTRFKAAVSQRDISDWSELLVHRRLHAVPANLVPQSAVRGSDGLRAPLTHHVRREDSDAAAVHSRRRGLADAAGGRRRGAVPGVEVPEARRP